MSAAVSRRPASNADILIATVPPHCNHVFVHPARQSRCGPTPALSCGAHCRKQPVLAARGAALPQLACLTCCSSLHTVTVVCQRSSSTGNRFSLPAATRMRAFVAWLLARGGGCRRRRGGRAWQHSALHAAQRDRRFHFRKLTLLRTDRRQPTEHGPATKTALRGLAGPRPAPDMVGSWVEALQPPPGPRSGSASAAASPPPAPKPGSCSLHMCVCHTTALQCRATAGDVKWDLESEQCLQPIQPGPCRGATKRSAGSVGGWLGWHGFTDEALRWHRSPCHSVW